MKFRTWLVDSRQRDAHATELVNWMEERLPMPADDRADRLARVWAMTEARIACAPAPSWRPSRRTAIAGLSTALLAAGALTPIGQSAAQAAGEVVEYVVERALTPAPAHPGDQMQPADEAGTDEMEAPAP
jgi:hypothetical protein